MMYSTFTSMKWTALLTALVCLFLGGCSGHTQAAPSPLPTTAPITINVNGEEIVLVPGSNVSPEIYEAAKNPEFLSTNDWIFVDGYWDVMPKGVTVPLEVLEPLSESTPGDNQGWQSYWLHPLAIEFEFPPGWYTATLASDAVSAMRLLDAPTLEASSRWISLQVFPNPMQASLQVWIAGNKPENLGDVIAEYEEYLQEVPVLRQQVMSNDPKGNVPAEHLLLWMPHHQNVLLLTAWPGSDPEVYDLLMTFAASIR